MPHNDDNSDPICNCCGEQFEVGQKAYSLFEIEWESKDIWIEKKGKLLCKKCMIQDAINKGDWDIIED